MRTAHFRDHAGYPRTGTWTERGIEAGATTYDPETVDMLPPCDPTKIVCQAGGYMDHREEAGFEDRPDRPELFLKTPNCVSAHGDAIVLPPERERVEFEAEFAVVVGAQCWAIDPDEAMDYVAGFTCVNDVSNRNDQEVERNWVRGKAFDASLPMGPALATPGEIPEDTTLTLRLNGELRQETTRSMLLFSVEKLLADVSELVTLEPGDVVATGTPFGPDALSEGDVVEVEIEGVGRLRNHVTTR
jgi:2-keto-4-pentenoate hydratase/2-oxohepta-3-ene-1,7-dioic acid hydratase in catechol pathway